jgi:hypothetical protein
VSVVWEWYEVEGGGGRGTVISYPCLKAVRH